VMRDACVLQHETFRGVWEDDYECFAAIK
jgi:hypothetical protein